jgi:GNAT superfamily N-acetyltransferase
VEVRRAVSADLDQVVRCQTTCWREAYTGLVPAAYLDALDDPAGAARRRERWNQNLDGRRDVWVAVDSSGDAPTVVGVASSGPSRDDLPRPPLELMTLYLRASHHGTGLSDRVIRAAIGSAAASLWVYAANRRAVACYRRHGFAPDGTEKIDPPTGVLEIRMVRHAVGPADG